MIKNDLETIITQNSSVDSKGMCYDVFCDEDRYFYSWI